MQVQNVAMASQASLRADMATLQQKISTLQSELAGVLGEFKSLQAEAELIEGSVVDEVHFYFISMCGANVGNASSACRTTLCMTGIVNSL